MQWKIYNLHYLYVECRYYTQTIWNSEFIHHIMGHVLRFVYLCTLHFNPCARRYNNVHIIYRTSLLNKQKQGYWINLVGLSHKLLDLSLSRNTWPSNDIRNIFQWETTVIIFMLQFQTKYNTGNKTVLADII